jgi:hypothetical protein
MDHAFCQTRSMILCSFLCFFPLFPSSRRQVKGTYLSFFCLLANISLRIPWEYYINLRGPVLIQYWRSFEDLEKFARDKSDPHLSAWRQFNKSIGSNGSVGIWHETYLVDPGKYEAVYGNMPVFGLASATKHVPAVGRRETARRRLGGENEPAIASPAQPTLVSQ